MGIADTIDLRAYGDGHRKHVQADDHFVIYVGIQEMLRHAKRLDRLNPTTEAAKRQTQAAATLLREAARAERDVLKQLTDGEGDS